MYRGVIGGALATLKNSRVTNQFRWTARMCTPVPWQTIKLSLDKFRPFNAVTYSTNKYEEASYSLIPSAHFYTNSKEKHRDKVIFHLNPNLYNFSLHVPFYNKFLQTILFNIRKNKSFEHYNQKIPQNPNLFHGRFSK